MSFWSGETLRQHLSTVVENADPDLIDCAAYTLRLGPEIYITPHESAADPQTTTKRRLEDKEGFCIPPGQFAFLHTEESVSMPPNLLGFISIKATTKFKGMINVSGFHVDPGYHGCLIFSVFNAGPSPIHLERGEPLFLLWIARLDDEASENDAKDKMRHNEIPLGNTGIPLKLINNIPGEIHSLQSLSKQMSDQKTEIDEKIHRVEIAQARHKVIVALASALFVGILVWSAKDFIGNLLLDLPTTSQTERTLPDNSEKTQEAAPTKPGNK